MGTIMGTTESDVLRRIELRYEETREILANHIITEDGCWEFQGYRDQNGYGRLYLCANGLSPPKRKYFAHRAAYAFFNGVDPGKKCVCHRCDNPGCINPGHLFLGSHAKNMADMVAKGRSLAGSRNPKAKLTDSVVIAIVEDIKAGKSNTAIAREYPVSHGMVSLIRHGKCWGNLLAEIGYNPDEYRRFKRKAA